MLVYCTICCKEKKTNKEPIDSINRYISNRIKFVFEKSQKDSAEFRILSGKYGLLKPNDKIPWYDKKLEFSDISALKKIVKKQILKQNICKIVFFGKDKKKNPDWEPYYNLIENACSELGVDLQIMMYY